MHQDDDDDTRMAAASPLPLQQQQHPSYPLDDPSVVAPPQPFSLRMLPQQPQPQPSPPRSKPIAIIRRKSSYSDDDSSDNDEDPHPDMGDTMILPSSSSSVFRNSQQQQHQSMPIRVTSISLLLRAPLLSSIPTHDPDELIPEFHLSESQQESNYIHHHHSNNSRNPSSRMGIASSSSQTQQQAYGSLRESQIQQERFLLGENSSSSIGKPHSFIRKRGGVGVVGSNHMRSNIATTMNTQNNNNTMSVSAPIRSSGTGIMKTGLTIGERIQQQRKLQLALSNSHKNSNNPGTTGNNYVSDGGIGQSGNNNSSSSMSSLLSSAIPSSNTETSTQPKRTSSILAAMLDQQQQQQQQQPHSTMDYSNMNNKTFASTSSTSIHNNMNYDNQPTLSEQHEPTDDNNNKTNTNSVLSSSLTGLEILQQHRRPWIALTKHRSLPPTKATIPNDMTTTTTLSSYHPSSMGISRSLSQPFLPQQQSQHSTSTSQPDQSQVLSSSSSAYASVFHHPNNNNNNSSSSNSYMAAAPTQPQYTTTLHMANYPVPNDTIVIDPNTAGGNFLLPPTAHTTATTTTMAVSANNNLNLLTPRAAGGGGASFMELEDMDDNHDEDDDDDIGEAFDLDME